MENRYKITYDLKQRLTSNIRFMQGDVDSSVIEVTLVDGGLPVNITGEVIVFRFAKSDKTIVYQDSTTGVAILDAPNGKVECVLMSNTLSVDGLVRCEIHRSKDGATLTAPTFSFTVGKGIGEGGVLSSNYITEIDRIKNDYLLATTQNTDIEIVAARGGEVNLGARLDADEADLLSYKADTTTELALKATIVNLNDIGVSQINKNKGLLNETYLSDTLKAQIAGTTAIGSTPPDDSITLIKTTFAQRGTNLVNKVNAVSGYVDTTTGLLTANAFHIATEHTLVKPSTQYAINYGGRDVYYTDAKVFISGVDNSAVPGVYTVTTPVNCKYIRHSLNPADQINILQIQEGATFTGYEPYTIGIPASLLDLPAMDYVEKLTYIGGSVDSLLAGFASAGATRVDKTPFAGGGVLKSISVRTNGSGVIKVKLFKLIGDTLEYKTGFNLTVASGSGTYYAGVDFTEIPVEAGWVIGYYSATIAIPLLATAGVNSYAFNEDVVTDKTGISGSSGNYKMLISGVAEITMAQLNGRVEVLESNAVALAEPTSLLMSTKFTGTTVPTDFVNVGFTFDNKLISPAVGGWDKQIYWDKLSTLDETIIRAKVKILDTNCNFALVKRDKANAGSCICQVDCVNSLLIIREMWNNNASTIPAVIVQSAIPAGFIVVGHEYLVEYYRTTIDTTLLKVTDMIDNDVIQVLNDYGVTTTKRPVGWDSPCIIAIGGSFEVSRFEYVSNQPINPVLAIYGDSFVEGDSMLDFGIENRYGAKIKTLLGGDCLICGKGGETSSGLLAKFDTDFMSFKPKFTLLAIGTNDGVYATWLTNIQALIAKVESRGSIPILATLTKMISPDRTAFMTSVNNWISASGYRYLDANLVTTVGNDRQTQDTSLFNVDGVHPNPTGHLVIYNRFLVDCPEVFDFN